jgi:hypothetical protein
MSNRKIQILVETYGYEDVNEMMGDYMLSGTLPGICVSPVCDNIEEYEPDQNKGYCTNCHNQTVASLLVMLGY